MEYQKCQNCHRVAVVRVRTRAGFQLLCNDCYWRLHWTQRKDYELLKIGGGQCQK